MSDKKVEYNKVPVGEEVNEKPEEVTEEETSEKKEKAISGVATKRKKNLIERLVVGVIGPDGLPSVGSYVNNEIIKPAIKNTIMDSATSAINMVTDSIITSIQMSIFGQSNHNPYGHQQHNRNNYGRPTPNQWGRPNQPYGGQPRRNYSSAYNQTPAQEPNRARVRGNFVDEYIIEDRREAMSVISALSEQIMEYGKASVADYYDLIGVESAFTDNSYGWEDLSAAVITPVRGGYSIKFPPVIQL